MITEPDHLLLQSMFEIKYNNEASNGNLLTKAFYLIVSCVFIKDWGGRRRQ